MERAWLIYRHKKKLRSFINTPLLGQKGQLTQNWVEYRVTEA
jgi:hypothetical protein